ncbi:nitrilase [Periconia macrospinosa]|uniref:Nitrilase n=1 Tax=Periconia macrospinosa TaxID=97972 RepID=A0A2V1E112_9PLEO|nr:nitrilase [Periconia macrospinosa]
MKAAKMPLAAIGQIRSTASLSHNLTQCENLVRKAAAAGADALFLPEASDYIASTPTQSLSLCQPLSTSPFVLGLQAAAKQHNISINVGVHEPSPSPSKLYNTLLWITPTGSITHTYRKLHLFDVDLSTGGSVSLRESASVVAGTGLTPPFPTPLGNMGMLICFDVRFPEASGALRARGAHVITYPSAFTVATGAAHWETLVRARAIETQCYVVAAAQVGVHDEEGKRESWGRGLIVDAWGTVVARLGGAEDEGEVAVAEVDLGLVERVRGGMVLRRREGVYGVVE